VRQAGSGAASSPVVSLGAPGIRCRQARAAGARMALAHAESESEQRERGRRVGGGEAQGGGATGGAAGLAEARSSVADRGEDGRSVAGD
jgi:hypothetical protein